MATMQLSSSTSLAVRDPWALVPSLGNLDAYISAVNRLPMLTADEESTLARAPAQTSRIWTPPAGWCCRTCAWWCRLRASTWATACRRAT